MYPCVCISYMLVFFFTKKKKRTNMWILYPMSSDIYGVRIMPNVLVLNVSQISLRPEPLKIDV